MQTLSIETILDLALREDLAYGDITTDNLFHGDEMTQARMGVRQSAVVSGMEIAIEVFRRVDERIICSPQVHDGDAVTPGIVLMDLSGPVTGLLKAERLALNFLQHLSGIATLTYQYVGAVSGTGAQITHTRKTHPGLRELEIQAVVHGGGAPHRKSLSHAVLIKDNHIRAAGGISQAVRTLRERAGHTVMIEVECDTPTQVEEALEAGVPVILLDNMPIPMLKEVVQKVAGRAVLEASGGVTLSNVLEIARTGVNIISTSQITMSAPAVDIGLDF